MRTLTFTLAAGQTTQPQEIAGTYFEIISAPQPLAKIDWTGDAGQTLDPWTGPQAGWFAEDAYRSFVITNGATAQTIQVIVGRNRGGSRAAPVSGNVGLTILPVETRAKAGQAFYGMVNQGAVAAQFSSAALANPNGSGKVLQLSAIRVAVTADCQLLMVWGTGTPVNAGTIVNKLSSGGASAGRVASSTAGLAFVVPFAQFGLKAGDQNRIVFDEPFIIAANATLFIGLATSNLGMVANFEWSEQ